MTTIMTALRDALSLADPALLWTGAGLALKVSLLVAIAGLATAVMGRRSAALRHFLWTLAFCGSLMLPLAATTLPAWEVLPTALESTPEGPVPSADVVDRPPASPVGSRAQRPARLEGSAARAGAPGDGDVATASIPVSVKTRSPRLTASSVALAGWLVGAGLLVLHLVLGRAALVLTARRAQPVRDPGVLREMYRIVCTAGVRRPIRLLSSARARVPMTWGVRRPVLLLPEHATSWRRDRLRLVLQHEIAHIRRFDDVTQTIAAIACALHWFNPLIWWAALRLRAESEHASDDLVLSGGARASEYAKHLLDLVSVLGRRTAPAGAIPLAQRSRFEGRLLAILDPARAREGVRRSGALALCAAAAGMVTLLGAVAPAQASAPPAPLTETAVPATSAPEQSPPAAASQDRRVLATEAPRVESAPVPTSVPTSVPTLAERVPAGLDPRMQAAVDAWAEVPPQERDTASVRALSRALLEDEVEEVRSAAAWALGQLEDPAATEALTQALGSDASVEVRRNAAWALGQIEDDGAVTALGEALSDADPEVRRIALWALGQIESPAAVGPLSSALQAADVETRRTAAWALGQIESEEAVEPLGAALSDSDAEVRAQAAWALGQIESEAAVGPLSQALQDASPDLRRQAAWALGQIESDQALDALAVALSDDDEEVAATAAWAIGQIEPDAAPAELLAAARSTSSEVRSSALWALMQIEDPAAVGALAELLQDGDPSIRETALHGLARVGNEEAIQAITGLLEDPDPDVRAAAVRALAGRGGAWVSPRPRPQPRPRPMPRPSGWR